MKCWISPAEAEAAMRRGRGRGVRIAVLDSGIDITHPFFGGKTLADDIAVVEGGDRLNVVEGKVCDLFGHGTAVAGIIHEVAPEAEIGSIRVLGESLAARTAIILEGARQAIDRGYHILNCSFGCSIPEHVLKYKAWLDEAYLRGLHVVAACNNSDYGRQEWPAFFTSVLAVNMARTDDKFGIFYKPGHMVEFAASGVDVEVPWVGGAIKKVTGSSFAAPRVAAMLACLLSEIPDLDPLQTKAIFQRFAGPWTRDIMAPNER